jgi:hypothetical protein
VRNIEATRKRLEGAVYTTLDRIAGEVLLKAQDKAPRDRGDLAGALYVKKPERNRRLVGTDKLKEIPAYVEFGTARVGAMTGHPAVPPEYRYGSDHGLPPIEELKDWADRHGVDAGALAVSIMERGGVRGQPYLHPAAEGKRSSIPRDFKNAIKGAV